MDRWGPKTAPVAGRRRLALWSAAAAATLALAGCTGGIGETGSLSPGTQTITDAMSAVTELDAPAEAFEPPRDKRILILYCSSTGQGCVNEGNEAKALAESLGWSVDMVDGKFDPTVWNQAVKQAVDSGVDGIIASSTDPNLMSEAMGMVQEKGIPFVLTNQYPADTDIAGVGSYIAPDPKQGGSDIADWIIADSGGEANVLLIDAPGYYSVQMRTSAVAERLEAECANCVIDTAEMSATTVGTTLAPIVTSRLQQNPGIDYVVSPDDCCVSFVNQGVQQAGRASTTKVISVGGFAEQLESLRTGGGPLVADEATPNRYMAWMAVDSLARLMAGLPTERYWAAPQRIWTTANIDEASEEVFETGWNLDFDYRPTFQDLWGTR